jgi:hypothetical protein
VIEMTAASAAGGEKGMELSSPIEGLVQAGARGRRLNPAGLASAIIIGIIGASVIFVTPGFLALIAAQSGLDDAHLGYIAAWDIDSTAVAIGISTFLLTRCNWRWAVGIGLALIALGNFGTALASGYGSIAAARVVAGAGEGICIGFAFAALGRAANPDRAFSIYLVAGAATSSAVLYSLPAMQLLWSPQTLFFAVGLIALACSLCLFYFPTAAPARTIFLLVAAGSIGNSQGRPCCAFFCISSRPVRCGAIPNGSGRPVISAHR